jgi:hypothetical protein
MKNDTAFKQKGTRIGAAGGFFNQLMSHNSTVPVVGEGATMLFYSDRHAYEVIEVDEKKKMVVIQRYAPTRLDKLGMSDSQDYEYKDFTEEKITLYYKWGGWKHKHNVVRFTDEARKKYGEFGHELHEAYKNAGGGYGMASAFICTVIPGITKMTTEWSSVNIIFGVKREYYDFSF